LSLKLNFRVCSAPSDWNFTKQTSVRRLQRTPIILSRATAIVAIGLGNRQTGNPTNLVTTDDGMFNFRASSLEALHSLESDL